jgi:hypothetical protein
MSQTIVFSSTAELARFLWGDDDPKANPAYPVLIRAKQAWMSRHEPGGQERARQALQVLDEWIRKNYFYPPHDAVTLPNIPRRVIALAYQPPVTTREPDLGTFWSLCTTDVMSDEDTVNHLRGKIDAQYGDGFFDQYIRSVRVVAEEEMLGPKTKEVTFGEASCESAEEVV